MTRYEWLKRIQEELREFGDDAVLVLHQLILEPVSRRPMAFEAMKRAKWGTAALAVS